MVDIIKHTLEKQKASFEDLVMCIEKIKENGDVVVIKLDGERSVKQYTAFISFPANKNRQMIRVDESDLTETILKLLKLYLDYK